MAGNFMGDGYAIGYHSASGLVRFISQTNFTTEARYLDLDGSNSLAFSGGGTPGWDLQAVGDVNDDGFEDVLVGAKKNSRCWFLYGGRNWPTNHIVLDAIGTNGVVLSSHYQFYWYTGYTPNIGRAIARLGDMNGDGYDDFAVSDHGWDGTYIHYPDVVNWHDHVDVMFGGPTPTSMQNFRIQTHNSLSPTPPRDFFKRIAGAGDVNGDGHNDIILIMYRTGYAALVAVAVVYGGPFIAPVVELGLTTGNVTSLLNGTNGFLIATHVVYGAYEDPQEWGNADISGDINGDGIEDIMLSVGAYYRASNNVWVIYGGQSPSTPPALRTPLWINVGQSATLDVQYTDLPTNILWMGCKKGDDYTFCQTNGAACPAWDVPMGVLYFTNSVALTSTSQVLTVSYTSTNALGSAAGTTTLVLQPLPEPLRTGVVVMAGALLTKLLR
jgi:hypothetical protein